MMQNPEEIKKSIISALESKGPSLPVHIAGEIKSSMLFASAFLGELVSEKKVKMSYMKVGSSRLYLLTGQESSLENFSQYLRSKEQEAFLLLKEKGFLMDSKQSPAIRVALREIRDFAIPFKSGEEIVWRYFLVPESKFKSAEEKPLVIETKQVREIGEVKPLVLEKQDEKQEKLATVKRIKGAARTKRKKATDVKEKFFAGIKEFLSVNSIELLDTKNTGSKEIVLKVRDKGEEKILVAYNKKKISDKDIVKAHNKVCALGLPYMVVGLNEPAKKTSELIKAIKNLSSIRSLK